MSTQTRTRYRDRLANGSSKSAMLPSQLRQTTMFIDPDYDQSIPGPKSTSRISPTWGQGNGEPTRKTTRGSPTSPVARPKISPTGNFQDRIDRSNFPRARDMASSTLPNMRSFSSPRSRQPVEATYENSDEPEEPEEPEDYEDYEDYEDSEDSEDIRDELEFQEFASWKKSRPDTPRFGRFNQNDRPRSLIDRVMDPSILDILGLVALFFIVLGLTSSEPKHQLQSAQEIVCKHLGQPSALCTGNLNFTLENVISHCQTAADKVFDQFRSDNANSSVDDVVQSCQNAVSNAEDSVQHKLEDKWVDVVVVKESLKQALCQLPGSSQFVDCVTARVMTAYPSSTSRVLSAWSSATEARPFGLPLVPTTNRDSDEGYINRPASNRAETFSAFAESTATSVADRVSNAIPHETSPASTAKWWPRWPGASTEPKQDASLSGPSKGVSVAIQRISRIGDLELQHNLKTVQAELHYLRSKTCPSVRLLAKKPKAYVRDLVDVIYWLQRDVDKLLHCIVRESNKAIHTLSKPTSYGSWPEEWLSFSPWTLDWNVSSPNTKLDAMITRPSVCRRHLVKMNERLASAIDRGAGLYKDIDEIYEQLDKTEFKAHQTADVEKLHAALQAVHNAYDALDHLKQVTEDAYMSWEEAHAAYHKDKALGTRIQFFGERYFASALVDIKKDRELAQRTIQERTSTHKKIADGTYKPTGSHKDFVS